MAKTKIRFKSKQLIRFKKLNLNVLKVHILPILNAPKSGMLNPFSVEG